MVVNTARVSSSGGRGEGGAAPPPPHKKRKGKGKEFQRERKRKGKRGGSVYIFDATIYLIDCISRTIIHNISVS